MKQQFRFSEESSLSVLPVVSEGKCIFFAESETSINDKLVVYDVVNGTFNELDDNYAEKIRTNMISGPLMFSNNRVSLPMVGDDGKLYVGLFDGNLDIIKQPIESSLYYEYSENRLLIFNKEWYRCL